MSGSAIDLESSDMLQWQAPQANTGFLSDQPARVLSLFYFASRNARLVDDLLSNPTLATARAKYLQALEGLPSPLGDMGRQLLQRITPEQWTLEWALPDWLCDALALSSDISVRLVLCNVFGLAYIRLEDDLADGELAEPTRVPALLLAHQFYREATLNYLELFDGRSPFWGYFKLWLDEWVLGTLHSNEPKRIRFSAFAEQDYLQLAGRGAPLKICCAAGCLLANRADAIGALTGALDHALAATVLLDHLHDWAQDLQAGRYNTFVAYASDVPQVSAHRESNRMRVLEMFYIGDRGRPYLDLVRDQLKRAAEVKLPIELEQFARYLITLESRATAYYDSMIEGQRIVVRDAAEKLFGPIAGRGGAPTLEIGGPLQ
jgi:hypothetical protein